MEVGSLTVFFKKWSAFCSFPCQTFQTTKGWRCCGCLDDWYTSSLAWHVEKPHLKRKVLKNIAGTIEWLCFNGSRQPDSIF